MATSGVLKITTRLTKKEFKKDLKSLTKDVKVAEAETNAMGEGATTMASGLGESVGAIAKIAVIAGLVIGAFVLIKKAVENIIAKNQSIADKIENIKNALSNIGTAIINVLSAYVLPIVEWIVNLIYKALSYINSITKAVWGYDLFTKKASDNLASGASSAKEIKKALAGFDTADILGSEDSGGGVGGIGGVDTQGLKDAIKARDIFEDIENTYQDMLDLLKDKKAFKEAYGNWDWLVMGIVRQFAGLGQVVVGFKDTIVGTSKLIIGFLKGDSDMMMEGAKQLGEGLKTLFSGVLNIIYGLFQAKFGLIKGIILTLFNWFFDIGKKAYGIINSAFTLLGSILKRPFEILKATAQAVFDWISEKIGGLISKVTSLKDGLTSAASVVKGNASSVISKGSSALSALWNTAKSTFGLASGGIVNNPGKGVALSNITVGEAGSEAVLPLTDDTLQKLANMIPVQIDLTNTIDGRVLSRRLETIRNNTAFSRNGG